MAAKTKTPPSIEYMKALQAAFDFFNKELFDDELPHVMLVAEPMRRAYGFFRVKGWKHNGTTLDVIGINPIHQNRDTRLWVSTLVHEMVHLEHELTGKAPKGAYHNKVWARMMEEIGLMPSTTGKPGGKKTGNSVSHYIIDGGAFAHAYDELIATGWSLDSRSLVKEQEEAARLSVAGGEEGESETKQGKRQKYTCPKCGLNAWAKFGALIDCGEDGMNLLPDDSSRQQSGSV